MRHDHTRLRSIFRRTDGRCHVCHGKVVFKNYGCNGRPGAWHVEHSRPRARGGSDHANNLYAAHIDCNLQKSVASSRSARARHGKTRAPYSAAKKGAVRTENTATGAAGGGLLGAAIGGPPGALIGSVLGALLGENRKVV